MRKYTNDELIQILKDFFNEHGKSPTFASDLWCKSTIRRRFGSWNDGLRAAGLPVNAESGDTPFETSCGNCNLKIVKHHRDIRKAKSNILFCSSKCAAIYNNIRRTHSDETKQKIAEKLKISGHKFSKEDHSKSTETKKKNRHQYILESDFDSLKTAEKRERIFFEQGSACNNCKLDMWLGSPITLEIEHKDGNNQNNTRENLELLCPNCHSLTKTWRGKNKTKRQVTDEMLIDALGKVDNIRQALMVVGLSPRGNNYERAKRLLENKNQPR